MSSLYIDSSALVAILLNEEGTENLKKLLSKQKDVVSSYLLAAELYSVARREEVGFDNADHLLESVSLFFPDRDLREEYRDLFEMGNCRGADAHHVACAMFLDRKGELYRFLTLDDKQQKIAKRCGLKIENP